MSLRFLQPWQARVLNRSASGGRTVGAAGKTSALGTGFYTAADIERSVKARSGSEEAKLYSPEQRAEVDQLAGHDTATNSAGCRFNRWNSRPN